MKAFTNAKIVMPDHIIPNGTVVLDGERIAAVGKKICTDGMEVVDLEGAYITPGLIEIHTHSNGDVFFQDDPVTVCADLLMHGVTDVTPALYFTADKTELLRQIRLMKDTKASGKAPNMIGLYMEAPYLNPKYGCDKENNPWQAPINADDYMPIIEEAGDFAKVWCVAPERENIEEFVIAAKKRNPSVVFSVAHSEAEPYQIEALMQYGLKLATHTTNATGTLSKYPECKGVCVDEAVYHNDDIFAELICDSVGIHVDPYLLRMIRKIKGDDRIILISDSYVAHGPVPEGYDGVTDINFDFEGEIAGTKITLDRVCRNMMMHTGASICEVCKFASYNPAKLLGLTDRGSVKPGNLANLLITDAEMNVKHVIFRGNMVK